MSGRLIENYLPADYKDVFSRELEGHEALMPAGLSEKMFTHLPRWVDGLMKLRNLLVKPLGLKGDGFKEHFSEMIKCRNDHELVWGMNDKHLCFHVSIWCGEKIDNKQVIEIITFVKYNNFAGKVYFSMIRLFHKLIVRSLLNRL